MAWSKKAKDEDKKSVLYCLSLNRLVNSLAVRIDKAIRDKNFKAPRDLYIVRIYFYNTEINIIKQDARAKRILD